MVPANILENLKCERGQLGQTRASPKHGRERLLMTNIEY